MSVASSSYGGIPGGSWRERLTTNPEEHRSNWKTTRPGNDSSSSPTSGVY